MIICPKCGAENGKRNPNPVKCCRCWYQFVRSGNAIKQDSGSGKGMPEVPPARGRTHTGTENGRKRRTDIRKQVERVATAVKHGPDESAGRDEKAVIGNLPNTGFSNFAVESILDVPTRKYPLPKCPLCKKEMTDMVDVFVCGKGTCRQKAIPEEEVAEKYERSLL